MRTITALLLSWLAFSAAAQTELVFTAEPENLGPSVNTAYSDFVPKMAPDGRTLYFLRRDFPGNVGAGSDDIWYSVLGDNGQWSVAQNLGSPLNNPGINSLQSISPDGNTIVLMGVYNYFDGSMSNGVSISHRDRGGWTFPKKQTIDKYENRNDHVGYYLSNDGQLLLMAIEMKKKYNHGGMDIYLSRKTGEHTWSKPVNLGNQINTAEDEFGMFLAADNKTLYFASAGHEGGLGDVDIWKSKRLDESWTNWSRPVNMGPKINSPDWDAYFSIPASGEYAYFVSQESGYGGSDIFRIRMPEAAKPDPVVLVSGKVLNAKTGKPVKARITYEQLPEGTEAGIARSEPENGAYGIVLPGGTTYGFRAVADGYYAVHQFLDASELATYAEVQRDLYLAPIEVGEVVRLNNIFFEFGKATLKASSFPELDRVAKLLTDNGAIEIELAGHTDNVGSEADNQTLSQQRADAVRTYLMEHGVPGKRMGAKGYGEAQPVTTNETEEGREKNRRVVTGCASP
ncbi:MAG: OmpA family protein [Bacteroidota bacterium]